MSDIFKEVEEELRADRGKALWKKYGPFVIGLAAVIVLGTAGHQIWQAWDHDNRLEKAELFAAAVRLASDDDLTGATTALAELGGPDGSYGSLAGLERARLLAESGQLEEALAIWRQQADDSANGSAIRGVSTLFYVMHQVAEGDPAELKTRLQPLLTADSAFRPIALELTAALALRQGDRAAALESYTQIADDLTAPPQLRTRATQMVAALQEKEQP